MTTATRSSWYRVRPPQIMRDTYPGNRVWQREVEDGHLSVIVGREPTELANGDRVLLWHLSISHRTNDHPPQPGRYPTWDEIRQARERFVPDEVTVALFLPPKAEYMHHPQDHLPPVGGDRMTIAATRAYALITGVAFVATVFAANWAITRYGAVPVGFGLIAPAGVYFAGLAFSFRDALHEFGGRWAVLAAIAAGAGASALVAPPALVVASAVAFAVSELADMAVYAPLRRRRWYAAVAASNVVGLVADSVIFLWLAFGSLAFLPGQVLGKGWMTLAAVAILAAVRWPRRVRRAVA